MNFSDRLFSAVAAKGTPLCVGFDPHLDLLPPDVLNRPNKTASPLERTAVAVQDFVLTCLEAVQHHVAVIKPQFAFFEQLGPPGMAVLARLCSDARSAGLIVIGDAKRSDIGSTAAAYARAYFEPDQDGASGIEPAIQVDALTINPYLGWDGILPFLKMKPGTGVFILVKTSNASGGDVQDLETPDGSVSEVIAGLVAQWGSDRIGQSGYSDVGAVVGATYPQQAKKLRQIMPNTPFLIPGYGFQGGGASDAVASFDEKGSGGIVNSSRGILFAYRNKENHRNYKQAAEAACLKAVNDLRCALA
jgi:orotidine-5'-phosphate decarboxylase